MSKLEAFRLADWEKQSQMLQDSETEKAVEKWLGSAALGDLRKMAGGSHLAGGKKNIIVVPGVMGSVLQSKGFGGIWWMDMVRARDKLNSLALASDGLRDIDASTDIDPCAIDIDYAPMRAAISNSDDFGGSIQFPYDWRRPLAASAERLRDVILKVHAAYGESVHLVGHSMGGLMIRTALMLHGTELWPKVGKVVFIATPHYGSPSIAGYLKNHLWGWEALALVGAFLSRETFRSLWGVLSLLPAPASIYPGTRNGEPHPCANFDLYDAGAYHLNLDATATVNLQKALDAAKKFYSDLYNWHKTALSPSERGRMLQISGVGRKTLFRLEVKSGWLGAWEDVEKITERTPGDPNREGDGRVPLASAELEGVQHRYIKGQHGTLQNIPAVVQEVLAWINDSELTLPDSAQAALSSHLAGGADSIAPNLDGTTGFSPNDDEYDRYSDIPEARIQELIAELQAGGIPGIDLTRIL
ncbi:alpha/beta fold hydrolase [Paraburkholderia sp. IMGN_8]|uniref:lipase family alpha/beta hydrolase n=1 Tax=Paraburkholderia sp. IMGN_8 TaxID=3136564 RepID=UPI00310107FD